MPSVKWPLPCAAYVGNEPYIFISYAHVDGAKVYPEIKILHEQGYRVWYDEGIDPGNEWPEEIARAIADSALFIVFISPSAIQSPNVKNEINFALNRRKAFLAVHLAEVSLPLGLELRMGDIEAIMKWRMSEDDYLRKMAKVLPDVCLGKPDQAIKQEKPPKDPPKIASQLTPQERPTSISSLSLEMVRVPGAAKFPTGTDDSGSCEEVNYPYEMGKTQVTYNQWKTVHDWAINHGYNFANPGRCGGYYDKGDFKVYESGHADHPVTHVSWRDSIIWCNALTEFCKAVEGFDFSCVYKHKSGMVLRDATHESACDQVTPDSGAKGFRLPTSKEWELAARYIDGKHWTPWDFASGATSHTGNESATGAVAWYDPNSGNSSHSVGTKKSNTLGIHDMSGNVWEWCFDWYPWKVGSNRVIRGGNWRSDADYLKVGIPNSNLPSGAHFSFGFRLVRTL